MARRQGRLRSMLLKDLVVLFLAAIGYSLHAKPYCQKRPHSLPPKSNVLKAYPCDAGAASRALYIIRNFFGVYDDMLRLGPSDRWASFQLVVVAISLGVRLTLPGKWSMLLRTSVLSQLHRLVPLLYLLVASYYGVLPSSSGRWYLLTHPVMDFLSNIVFPVHPISECVFCATSMLLTIAIWWRYGYLATSNFGSASAAMLAGGAARAQAADNTCIDDVIRSAAALAAGTTLPGMVYGVVTATTGAGADAVNGIGMSSYHLGRWLPFQLLMNLVALTATLLLEWWRGPPDDLVITESSMFSWLQRTNQGPSHLGELGGCGGDSAAPAVAAAADCSGSGRKAKANAAIAICTPARPNVQHTAVHESCGSSDGDGARETRDGGRNGDGFGSNMKLIAGLAEPNSTDANEAVRQLRPLCNGDVLQRPEPLMELTAPPPFIETVSDVVMGADAAKDSRGCGDADSNVAANDRDHDEADPDHDMENGSTGHGAGAADMGYDSARNVATDMAAVEAEARDVLRWSTGVPVQAALGSPSSFGPALWRDSEILAEGFMLGCLDAGDQENGDAGRAAGPRSDGSSRVDVARHDQQVRSGPLPLLPPPPALRMSGGGVDGAAEEPAAALPPPSLLRTSSGGSGDARVRIVDGARAAAAAVGPAIPASEPFPVAGHGVEADVVVAAASAVVQHDDSIDDDTPGRHHNRAHRLLSSLSSQASQSPPQHDSYTHSHSHSSQQHIHSHGRLESQSLLQLQFQRYWQGADQLMDDRTVPQLPPQPQQPQERQYISQLGPSQNVWPFSAPDVSFSTAAVMAAVQQARRPAYVPRVRLITTHIKVYGAQPDQLQSGYTQRLENVASAAGQRLMGVYVRAGCIELVLDSADWVDGDIPSEAMPQSGGRDSGPLPAPLQPRPLPYPPYWSAPNTPSRLPHEQQQQQQQTLLSQALQTLQPPLQRLPTHDGAKYQQQGGGAATQPQISYARAPQDAAVVVSPGSAGSHGSAACLSLAPIPGVVQRGGGAAAAGQGQGHGYGYGHGGGGSRSSMQGGGGDSGIPAIGGDGGIGTDLDLDLGAVIRALRLRRTEGSAESINDLVSEHDMDLEFGDRLDNSISGQDSGGSGVEASSKETSVGSGGRRGVGGGGADAFSPAALGLTATGSSVATHARLLQQLQQQVLLQHQQQQQQRFQDAGAVMPAMPPPPPQPQLVAASAVGPISRQALVLGGPRDPMAPGIISLNPRVLATLPRASSVIGGSSNEEIVVRFSAVVRRVSTIPFGAVTSNVAVAAAGLDPEFTMRVRGEYLPLRTVRLEPTTVATRVGLFFEPPQIGAAPRGGGGAVTMPAGGVGSVGLGGEDGVLPIMLVMGSGERLQDTSSDIDTGYHYVRQDSEGGRPVPAARMWHESFLLELLEAPQCPGLLLVDLRGGGEPAAGRAPNRAVPIVAVADADAAAELQAAVECWEGTQSELDDLLLDLGTWLHHMSRPSPQVVPGAGVHEGGGGPAAAAAATAPILDQRLVALGQHLLSYAEVCGWRATAVALQDDLAKHGIPRADTNGRGSSPTLLQPVLSPSKLLAGTVPSATAAASMPAVADVAPASLEPIPQGPQPCLISQGGIGGKARGVVCASRLGWAGLLPLRILAWRGSSSGLGVGFMDLFSFGSKRLWSGATPEEREGLKAFQQAYISQQIWLITLLDVISLAALLFRGRHEPLLAPSNVVTFIACCVGAVTAAARVVMPHNQWLHLAEVMKVPRHVCYCLTKGLIGMAGFPAPPGITSYELGLPVFIFEAVIVPWSCLLSVPTAAAVAAAKIPFYMALWHRLALMALKDSEVAALETAGCSFTANEARGVSNADALCPYNPGLGFTSHGQGAAIYSMLSYLSPFRRMVRALTIFCIFVLVTAACHIHMLSAYYRQKRRRAAVELAQSAKAGKAAASPSVMTRSAGGARDRVADTLFTTLRLRKRGKW